MTDEKIIKAVEAVQEGEAEKARKEAGQPKPQTPPTLENAIADMKRQLRAESKATLIKQWIGLYAQVIKQQKEINDLKMQLNSKTEGTKND